MAGTLGPWAFPKCWVESKINLSDSHMVHTKLRYITLHFNFNSLHYITSVTSNQPEKPLRACPWPSFGNVPAYFQKRSCLLSLTFRLRLHCFRLHMYSTRAACTCKLLWFSLRLACVSRRANSCLKGTPSNKISSFK